MEHNSISKAMLAASSGMSAQAFRLRVVSENLSNADTHGYQRKLVTFDSEINNLKGAGGVSIDGVTLDRSQGEILFDPAHPLADEQGYVALSNVDMMIELADAREAGRSYEANLSTFKQAAQMYSGLIDLLRR
ncbi:flagellar basal body rod protein FlgC [Hellea sp.]|nr:flagellar basal body rod protein FlgC [Hellea sp.]